MPSEPIENDMPNIQQGNPSVLGRELEGAAAGGDKVVNTLNNGANTFADNKSNRWFVLGFWVLLAVSLVSGYKIFVNGSAVQSLQRDKVDTATQQTIKILLVESEKKDRMIERKDDIIREQAQTIRSQDSTINSQNSALETYNRVFYIQQNQKK